jgi:threonine/homoserine/homoserine lactone efflux protein
MIFNLKSFILVIYMMIELIIFTATSFFVGLSGALAPGPMLTVTISDSMEKGARAGPLIVAGHIIAETGLIFLIFAGLGWLIGSSLASFIIGLVGGIVLIYMGIQIFRNSPELKDTSYENLDNTVKSRYSSILNGIITSITNPFFFIWWAAIGAAFMYQGLALAGILGIFAFLIGHWSADLVWISFISFFSSKGTNLMKKSTYKNIMRICGVFLVLVGGYFFTASLGII